MDESSDILKKWLTVQAYKHDGRLHRQWSPGYCVEETENYWAIASKASLVIEDDGRHWMTKENAVFLLFKNMWMNIICMFKEGGGICYYANIASPTIFDEGYLRYIDYDLDLKLYPDHVIKALDENEFENNIVRYGYSPELVDAIRHSFNEIRSLMTAGKFPFSDEAIRALYARFLTESKPFIPHS